MIASILWNISPDIITIGSFTLRWYGILFALGLLCGGYYIWKQFKKMGLPSQLFEGLLIYLFLGIFLGARLGHCLFYEPEYYLHHPLEMILPITILPSGHIELSGYHGLASHGGGVGLLLGLLLYRWKHPFPTMRLADVIAIGTPLAGSFIRLGNLMNSEIAGNITTAPWGFIFTAIDNSPRHPTQLYESIYYLITFLVCAYLYKKGAEKHKGGFYLGLVIVMIMVFRFCIEFLKLPQEDFENQMTINMGQWLSIPYIICGIILMLCTYRNKKSIKNETQEIPKQQTPI